VTATTAPKPHGAKQIAQREAPASQLYAIPQVSPLSQASPPSLQPNGLMGYVMDNSIRLASQAGFTSLYHYEDFQPEPHKPHTDRVADILLNHRNYCSNPAGFNDPWDCKPYFNLALLDDPVNHSAAAESLIATHTPGPNDEVINHWLRTVDGDWKRNGLTGLGARH
jgi:hypothetical protein